MVDNISYNVKANSHIITLLGDELIGSNSLALFELVKNSYDADATIVTISFNNLFNGTPSITIEDNGIGMTPEIVENAWLTIGTDYKRKVIKSSSLKNRTSLGNKGVGRLAVHRLANVIKLVTKSVDSPVCSSFEIDWNELIESSNFIEGLKVNVKHDAVNSLDHGTKIVLSELRETRWTRVKVCEMVSKLQNIKNPYNPSEDFNVIITSNDPKVQEWIDSVKSPIDILNSSLFQFKFRLYQSPAGSKNAVFDWLYNFNPQNFASKTVDHTKCIKEKDVLPINIRDFKSEDTGEHFLLKNDQLAGIQYIEGQFYAYNLDSKILNITFGPGSIGKIKDFVYSNCGIKVFRDNIRVFNYGEPTDDWLGLDQNKMKRAGNHFAKGQTLGAINLHLNSTISTLVEKTNREGFIENDTYANLVAIVQSIFGFFERQSLGDREKVKSYIENTVSQKKIGFSESIKELEDKLRKRNLDKEFAGILKKVKHDYNNMRDVMLNSGMSGLNLTVIFHEVEREMGFINNDINRRGSNIDDIKIRIKGLMDLIEKFTPILKKNKTTQLKASKLIARTLDIHRNRFLFHNIILSSPLETNEADDFIIKGAGGLLMGALSNIIDNAIYWVSRKRERMDGNYKSAVLVTTDIKHFDGPAIIVADNGEGFMMEPEDMILPFRTLKPNGMGVGLYYVNLIMEMMGGKLLLSDSSISDIPSVYNGACAVLVFPLNINK